MPQTDRIRGIYLVIVSQKTIESLEASSQKLTAARANPVNTRPARVYRELSAVVPATSHSYPIYLINSPPAVSRPRSTAKKRRATSFYPLLTSAVACLPHDGGWRRVTRSASTYRPAARLSATLFNMRNRETIAYTVSVMDCLMPQVLG